MKPVRVLQRLRGSPDGVRVHWYAPGVYDEDTDPPMSPRLARVLIDGGLAEPADGAKMQPADYETKVVEPRTDKASAFDAAELTVKEVLSAVDAGKVTVAEALDSERAGKDRTSLVRALTERQPAE